MWRSHAYQPSYMGDRFEVNLKLQIMARSPDSQKHCVRSHVHQPLYMSDRTITIGSHLCLSILLTSSFRGVQLRLRYWLFPENFETQRM
jgi:hypothetical protein